MRSSSPRAKAAALAGLALLLLVNPVAAQKQRPAPSATPTAVERAAPAPALAPGAAKQDEGYDPQRLLAGHYLRRMGFGPSPRDMETVLRLGPAAYVEQQLDPASINDAQFEAGLPRVPKNPYALYPRLRRWYLRMLGSRKQLQEKMTLVWHEHFATSLAKVGVSAFMSEQEETLRRNALGSFRQLLVDMTKDRAMLVWLDNNYNSGRETNDAGEPVPPNENYARELLQLFSMGPTRLNLDGTPVIGPDGLPVANYTEDDVKEVARALTGWYIKTDRTNKKAKFAPYYHDEGSKTILGTTIAGRTGKDGAREVEDVVDLLMRHPSTAPFIAKILVQKLATETPSPGYVSRVATVFRDTSGDLRATVRAVLLDAEFTSPAVVRSQYKTPVEHFTGAMRALDIKTEGYGIIDWTSSTRQLVYFPPSVFSFYRPGEKGSLVTTALVTARDKGSDALAAGYDADFDANALVRQNGLDTPEKIVDFLADRLLAAPLQPEARARIVDYMDGRTDEEKLRGALWLVMVSPDYQRN
jgi:uncharacterized protein (DUF1800 family)